MRNVRIDLPEEVWTAVKIKAAKDNVNLHVVVTEAIRFALPKEYREALNSKPRKEAS